MGCAAITENELPQPFRKLLSHSDHMTTTLENHYDQPVSLEVLSHHQDGEHYSRQIILRLSNSRQLVEFGVVRLHLEFTGEDLRREILAMKEPLGDLLIKYDVLRRIEPLWFLKIEHDAALLSPCADEINGVSYGRIAVIHCNGEPAIELLEVVASIK